MFDLSYTTDLRKGLIKTPLTSVFALGDKNAHTLRVMLMNGSEKQLLDGQTVSGYCIRYRDNATVNLKGRVENGQAVVTLSPGCYAQKGLFAVAILVGAGSADETTVFIGEGTVTQTNTDTIVDEENIIPSVAELLAMIQQLKDAVSEANAAVQNANTAAQTANTAAGTATNAASTANGAASTANTAAERANTAAKALEEAPIPTGTESTYQAGTSPTTPPTGTWQSTIPAVPHGQYLWTRTVQSYTNGEPTTYYSVARQGMDGSGSVSSVDGVAPDASGNVPLGAVRSVNGSVPDASGNVDLGELGGGVPDGGTKDQLLIKQSSTDGDAEWQSLTAELLSTAQFQTWDGNTLPQDIPVGITYTEVGSDNKGFPAGYCTVLAVKKNNNRLMQMLVVKGNDAMQIRNANDGTTWNEWISYMNSGDTAADSSKLGGKAPEYYLQLRNLLDNSDFRNLVNQRGATSWSSGYGIDRWMAEGGTVNVADGGITVASGAYLVQRVPGDVVDTSKTYTLAAGDAAGNVYVGNAAGSVLTDDGTYGFWTIKLSGGRTYAWAALYEGSYNAENLPSYVPKGYTVELAECLRYCKVYESGAIAHIFTSANNAVFVNFAFPTSPMRFPPSLEGTGFFYVTSTAYTGNSQSDASLSRSSTIRALIQASVSSLANNIVGVASNQFKVVLTADL